MRPAVQNSQRMHQRLAPIPWAAGRRARTVPAAARRCRTVHDREHHGGHTGTKRCCRTAPAAEHRRRTAAEGRAQIGAGGRPGACHAHELGGGGLVVPLCQAGEQGEGVWANWIRSCEVPCCLHRGEDLQNTRCDDIFLKDARANFSCTASGISNTCTAEKNCEHYSGTLGLVQHYILCRPKSSTITMQPGT